MVNSLLDAGLTSAALVTVLDADLCAGAERTAAGSQHGLDDVLWAAFALLLHRYGGDERLDVAIRSAGQMHAARADFTGDPSLVEVLARRRSVNAWSTSPAGPLELAVARNGSAVALRWTFDRTVLDEASVGRMAVHLSRIVADFASAPQRPGLRLRMLDDAERNEIERLSTGPRTDYGRDLPIAEIFAERVRETPDAVAVQCADGTLTYADLDAHARTVAQRLRAFGVMPGSRVGVAIDRHRALPAALLGILRAGATYVPLDLSYPPERLQFMLADAGAGMVVTAGSLPADALPAGIRTVDVCAATAPLALEAALHDARGDLAYIMYTSGSTGRPKGVAVPQRGVVRLVRKTNYMDFTPDDAVLHAAPLAFDASTFEIWGALLNGARLVMPRPGLLSVEELCETVVRQNVSVLFLTPSLFKRLVEAAPRTLGRLRCLVLGGDVPSPEHAVRFLASFASCRLVNGYGPTENTTFSTTYDITRHLRGNAPIGRPIANSTAYVLAEDLSPAPLCAAGELYVGGDGVASGYLNLDALTAERFVPDPFQQGGLLYRTGDRARLRPDGNIEFLGRTDDQVKVRGYRIELEEPEGALAGHPGVAEAAVVVAQRAGEKELVAFAVPARGVELDARDLREYSERVLPRHAVPNRFEILEGLPYHPSGKVDRAGLVRRAEGQGARMGKRAPSIHPNEGVAGVVAAVWREVLGHDVDADANFFDAGGDSLRLIAVHQRLQDRLRVRLSIVEMFRNSTIRKLAAAIVKADSR